MSLITSIDKSKLPQHVAVIMDGNGRWAKQKGKLRIFGHKNGVKAVRETTEAAAKLGIPYVTLYAFSTENWNRPKAEVNALMELLVETISNETPTLNKNKIKLQAIGNIDSLPKNAKNKLAEAINATAHNTHLTLILALSYSSKWEMIEAVKKVAEDYKNDVVTLEGITDSFFSSKLSTKNYPDPELMIRTSGEHRISNFLLWQLAYAELYFTPVLWPDFREEDFYEAILSFQNRERRFGKTSEQLVK